MTSVYTYDLLENHLSKFREDVCSTWKHIQSITIHQVKNQDPYIAEIVIHSMLPNPENYKLRESFTSSIYITNSGDIILKGADYFNEVKTWLHNIRMTT